MAAGFQSIPAYRGFHQERLWGPYGARKNSAAYADEAAGR